VVSPSEFSGITNFTDSSFSFSGLVSHIGPFSGTGLPRDVDRVEIFFTSGKFSIVSVPEPGTIALCGIGLAFFAGFFSPKVSRSWSD
jgi:hypothetical protein